jgi:hypothetical protein
MTDCRQKNESLRLCDLRRSFDEIIDELISFCSTHFKELMKFSMPELKQQKVSLIEAVALSQL